MRSTSPSTQQRSNGLQLLVVDDGEESAAQIVSVMTEVSERNRPRFDHLDGIWGQA